jgi:proteasome accessory factor A
MSSQPDQPAGSDGVVPKLCGSDVELGNFIIRRDRAPSQDTGGEAAGALLAQVSGHSRPTAAGSTLWSYGAAPSYGYDGPGKPLGKDLGRDGYGAAGLYRYWQYAQDYGRKFLPANGGCIYIDLNHLELCTPECRSAFDHLAASRAMLMIAREAMTRANQRMPQGSTIKVLANNSDGRGHSYGSHMSFLVTRECFDNILYRKMHYLQFLASWQAAAILLTGAGKVGSENGKGPVKYQISARADFMETVISEATTYRRPLVNARDESLAQTATDRRLARLHVIAFDHPLCHHAVLLRVGMMQVILCMIEQDQVPTRFLLDDPVASIHRWSRDPGLTAKSPLVSGEQYTAVEFLLGVYERARQFVEAGRAQGLVPRVGQIMAIWGECLEKLCHRDMDYLASRIDWVAKQYLLDRAASRHGGWDAVRSKYLDNLWASLDPNEGLYWSLEKAGAAQKLVEDGEVEHFVHEPPEDTRAWLRAWALRHAAVEDVDWDMIRLRTTATGDLGWPTGSSLSMSDPLEYTRARCQSVLESASSPAEGLRTLLSPQPAGALLPSPSATAISDRTVNTGWPLGRPIRAVPTDNSSLDQGA